MKKHYILLTVILNIFLGGFSQDIDVFPRGVLDGYDSLYAETPQKTVLTRSFYDGAPNAFSLKRFAPTPKSQSRYGTCAGWAVAYCARTIIEAQRQKWTSKYIITKNAFSPTFQYRISTPYNYLCKGAYTSRVISSLSTIGSVPMKDFYVRDGKVLCPTNPVPSINKVKASKHKITDFTTLWSTNFYDKFRKISRVKTSISQGNPVVISIICPSSFDNKNLKYGGLWAPYENPNASTSGRKHGRHAVCVVGYDNNKFGGAFEIQNSWGTSYGNGGYVWVRYNDFAKFTYQAYELVSISKPKPKESLLAGSLRLYDMDDKKDLAVELAAKTRNWNVVTPSSPIYTNTNTNYTYKVKPSLLSGSKMRMYLKSEKPCFVYMIGTGTKDKTVKTLFPVSGISPLMNYRSSQIALPSEKHYFELDKTTGKNYIIVIFSKTRLNIADIKRKIAYKSGSVSHRVKSALGTILIDSKYINFDQNKIKFNVSQNSSYNKAFAMIIQFNQVSK